MGAVTQMTIAHGPNVLVTTSIGDLPEKDLDITVSEQPGTDDVWIMAREGRYIGKDPQFASHVDEIVRRDVWVTIKRGNTAAAIASP